MDDTGSILPQLMAVLEDRKASRLADSYTVRLLDGGVDAIAAKITEEAAELIEAGNTADETPQKVVHEAADLIYHLLVMLVHCGVKLSDVEAELARRFGTSGLEEKASREEGS